MLKHSAYDIPLSVENLTNVVNQIIYLSKKLSYLFVKICTVIQGLRFRAIKIRVDNVDIYKVQIYKSTHLSTKFCMRISKQN